MMVKLLWSIFVWYLNKMKFRINEKSISTKIDKLLDLAEAEAKEKLIDVAEDLTKRTPVDTGAYAESFSVSYSNDSRRRSVSSKGRPQNQDIGAYRNTALQMMTADIRGLDLVNNQNTSVAFRNRAPHAGPVERKYNVFGSSEAKYR